MKKVFAYRFGVGTITSLGEGVQSYAVHCSGGQVVQQHRGCGGIEGHVGQHLHGVPGTDLNLVAIQIAVVVLRRRGSPPYPPGSLVVHADLYVIRRSGRY